MDEDQGNVMRCIEYVQPSYPPLPIPLHPTLYVCPCLRFNRIKGGKPFNHSVSWFQEMMQDIGQM